MRLQPFRIEHYLPDMSSLRGTCSRAPMRSPAASRSSWIWSQMRVSGSRPCGLATRRASHHAIGADTETKQELDLEVLSQAGLLIVDSLVANERYGDVGRAIQCGAVSKGRVIELGRALTSSLAPPPDTFTVAKLVGLGIQDFGGSKRRHWEVFADVRAFL